MPFSNQSSKWHLAQRLEKRWWNRYLKKKDVEAYLTWKRNYWKAFLDRIDHPALESIHGPVPEAGCGPATDSWKSVYHLFRKWTTMGGWNDLWIELIVSDGEGASKFIEYRLKGAASDEIARILVRTISDSTLVKCAMFGRDPNWGRILAAAGRAGVPFDSDKVDLHMGAKDDLVPMILAGQPQELDQNMMKKLLRESEIHVEMNLHDGDGSATGWGSDMTTDYVLFNSVYTT